MSKDEIREALTTSWQPNVFKNNVQFDANVFTDHHTTYEFNIQLVNNENYIESSSMHYRYIISQLLPRKF